MSTPIFDIIVFGATGFTGQQVAKYFQDKKITHSWAIAGRNQAKLEKLADSIGIDHSRIIIADGQNKDQVFDMVKIVEVGLLRLF